MENQYLDLLRDILENGTDCIDRTKVGTRKVFGRQMRFDLSEGFPLLTTKKMHFKSIVYELLWFLRGETNIKYLTDNGVSIWNEWADKNGDLGRVYGAQWRTWKDSKGNEIDQIRDVIGQIKTNPNSRRLIVSAWNVGEINEMALPPCHLLFQFFVANGKLSCMLTQRSGDAFLGVCYNIASYALLIHIIANICDLKVGEFIHTIGDAHIYNNHFEQVKLQLSRKSKDFPILVIKEKITDLDKFLEIATIESFELTGYKPHSKINAPVAV